MSRDKFAAMASRAQKADNGGGDGSGTAPRQQPQEQQVVSAASPAPKGDKMAASQQQTGVSSSSTTATTSPPKRDKMAALTARSGRSPVNINTDSNDLAPQRSTPFSPPKRDKMAALAARSNTATAVQAAPTNTNPQQQQKDVNTATSELSRRDKLAALATRSMNNSSPSVATSASAPSRSNKLAKLAGESQSSSASATTANTKSEAEVAAEAAIAWGKHLTKLRERLSKRKGILDSLDRAEELTCKLLTIASKTTDALQDLNFSSNLAEMAESYRSTLQELHPLLTKGTEEMIKPYQNHTQETKQSMYAARVEMRLAKERLEVFKTFSELEKSEREKKNPISETISTAIDDSNTAMGDDESDRKRKR